MIVACPHCTSPGICWKCGGAGYYDDAPATTGTATGGRRRGPSTPKSRDAAFAALLGIAAGGWLMWIGHWQGFGGERTLDYVIPIAVGIAIAVVLARVTVVIRPLRWIASAAVLAVVVIAAASLFMA